MTFGRAVGHPGVDEINPSGRRCTFRVRRVSLPTEVITLAVRWYVQYSLSYRDVEELLAERGIEVDHTTLFRWVMRFTPLFTPRRPGRAGTRLGTGGSPTKRM